MKKTIAILTIILLSGCGVRKKTNQSQEHSVDRSVIDTRKESFLESDYLFRHLTWSESDIKNRLRITIRNYDTSLPVDPATGTPPVFNEVVLEASGEQTSKESSVQIDSAGMVKNSAETDNSHIDKETIIKTKIKEKPGISFGRQISLVIFSVCLLLILVFLLYKKFKR